MCSSARNRLPKWHSRLAAANRLVVALGQGEQVFLLDQLRDSPDAVAPDQMPLPWQGLCIYSRVLPREQTRVYYLVHRMAC